MINISEKLKLNTTTENFLITLREDYLNRFGKSIFQTISYSGTNIQTNCPFHSDRKPSFGVKSDGVWHCFSCGRKGNLISLIKKLYNFSYEDAKQWILDHFVNIDISERDPLKSHLVEELKTYVSEDELKKYRTKHPYMYERHLTDEVIDLFDIGYDADFKLKSKKDNKEYNIPSLTFPVRDIKGRTLFVATRSIEGKVFHYPDDTEKPLYGIYELLKTKTKPSDIIWITESMLNCTTLNVYGKKAIALNGTGSLQQYEELKKLPYGSFVIALDPDEAGKKGTNKLIKALKGYKFLYLLDYGDVEDDINKMPREVFNKLKIKRILV